MGFNQLLNRLLGEARLRIRNGQLTESGLARLSGISQPHMHHILMGKRGLQPAVADRLLAALSLDIADLIEAESSFHAQWAPPDSHLQSVANAEPAVLVPMLAGLIGAGFPLPLAEHPPKYLPLPRREVPRDSVLCAARLAHDPSLGPLFRRDDLVVIAMDPLPPQMPRETPEAPQVIESGGAWQVRMSGAGSRGGDSSPRTIAAGEVSGSLVGVIVLTIRRMHSLRLPFPPALESE